MKGLYKNKKEDNIFLSSFKANPFNCKLNNHCVVCYGSI